MYTLFDDIFCNNNYILHLECDNVKAITWKIIQSIWFGLKNFAERDFAIINHDNCQYRNTKIHRCNETYFRMAQSSGDFEESSFDDDGMR